MMNSIKNWLADWVGLWNRFWFTPGQHATLCLMRILVGLMLLYTHAVWTLELPTFFASSGVFGPEYREAFNGGSPFVWSHFSWSDSPAWLWGTHFISLLILFAFTIGAWTRVTSILSFLIVVSYANRAGGALFGLDQINGFLTLYLAVAPSGWMYSFDAWRRNRVPKSKPGQGSSEKNSATLLSSVSVDAHSTLATVGIRLIQIHLCVVYLFAGLGKLQGEMWWDGTAIWGALASYEYQTIDMTFLVHLPWVVNIITLVSLAWEVAYAFLVWPKLTRPIFLGLAVMVHLGIGMCMGMMTFGVIMIIANMAFLEPALIQRLVGRVFSSRATAT